jgi:hypothetical protein
MEPGFGSEEDNYDNPEAASQGGELHRKSTEQNGYRQRDLGREPGIFFMPAQISDGDENDDTCRRNRN